MSGIEDVRKQGYAVLRHVVPSQMCEVVVAAIRDELGIDRDDPAAWELVLRGA
jgi:hypothetical protein